MAKIDNDKMWASILSSSQHLEGIRKEHIVNALKEQGLEHKDGEIVEIEPEHQELTEFEEAVRQCMVCATTYNDEKVKKEASELLSIARKQFQPEFDEELELAYKTQDEVVYNRGYDKGFEDARKQIASEIVKPYTEKGRRLYDESIEAAKEDDTERSNEYYWGGFTDCADVILKALEKGGKNE